ncbi:hypothetical protein NC653_009648 [Populus alba x Populus x berolinensis]|uniref:Uncharacterized protein n=1 Tax=Populus alba x Populus x berolinensis TaxID=444605 RepID=A0AAD6R9I7_9ROSI|nr:hypothetical protein NC653_009648 [Populus alba x Populus x berolinensis]
MTHVIHACPSVIAFYANIILFVENKYSWIPAAERGYDD